MDTSNDDSDLEILSPSPRLKDTMSEEDTCAPRCKMNMNQSQCKTATSPNLDGTWGRCCQHHRNKQNEFNTKQTANKKAERLLMQSKDTPPNCASCTKPTRPKKNASGYTKYCDPCADKNAQPFIVNAKLAKHLALKRKFDAMEETNKKTNDEIIELEAQRDHLAFEIEMRQAELADSATITLEYENSKAALLKELL